VNREQHIEIDAPADTVWAVFSEAPRHRVAGRPVSRPGVVKASGAASGATSTPCAAAACAAPARTRAASRQARRDMGP